MIEIPEFQYVIGCIATGFMAIVIAAIAIGCAWLWITGDDQDWQQ